MTKYLLLFTIAILGASGQLMMKMGANNSLAKLPAITSINTVLDTVFIFLKNYYILGSITIYGFGFFLWIFTLTKFNLSQAFPVVAIVYVLVLFSSWFFLKEDITITRMIGSIVIMIGVILVMSNK